MQSATLLALCIFSYNSGMDIWDRMAEEKISRALALGEFDDLPGAGAPLQLDDDSMVPEELRVAYRICKNAGILPPEVEQLKQDASIHHLVSCVDDADDCRARDASFARLRCCGVCQQSPGVRQYKEKLHKKFL